MAASERQRLSFRLARSPSRAIAAAGLFGFVLAAAVTLVRGGVPAPWVHDEFSYLLAADTFAHGRLANPPHPLGAFFETFHVLQQPVYASKYPPAQGAVLAVGQVLTGQPIVGVWLSYGLMCAALTWMLFAWARPRWALWGGLFAALYLVGYQAAAADWAASYWGGAVAATGSALLFGGLKRAIDRPGVAPAALMALGVGILANSRPYEGLLVALPPGLFFLSWLWRGRAHAASWRMVRVGGTAVLVLGAIGLFMGTYNSRITGSAWKFPYLVYEEAYGASSVFLWGKSQQVKYRHEVMQRFYDGAPPQPRTPAEFVRSFRGKFEVYGRFFLPMFASVLAFLLPWVFRDPKLLLPGASVGLLGLGLLGETWANPYYASPLVAPLLILSTAAARRLALLRTGRAPIGRYLLRLVFACTILSALIYPVQRLVSKEEFRAKWYAQRANIEQRLERDGARHLIIVQYGADHDPSNEWVYNRAQIDAAPVIWARSLGADENARLLAYYSDRVIWALDVQNDVGPFDLQPLAKPPGPRAQPTPP